VERADILIAGAGPVGLTLAVAIGSAAPDVRVVLVDSRSPAERDDGRASAIAVGGQRMLAQLDVWPEVTASAQAIEEVIVTDSRASDVVRPVFLSFDATMEDGESVAHMVPNGTLTTALLAAAERARAALSIPDSVEEFGVEDERISVRLRSGRSFAAGLLVAADGARSRLRELAKIRTVSWDYQQVGIVGTVAHERPHRGRAEEHFLPSGPLALLPLKGNRSSFVWTQTPEVARRLIEGDEEAFNAELTREIGHHLGTIKVEGQLQSHPLVLRLARDFVRRRFAPLGDAAHSIHPLAGQGLNLGLRDAAALAETLIDALRLGLDIGTLNVLERYERWRRYDMTEMAVVTDGLNRLFSNDNVLLRVVRDFGLGLVDRMPWAKRLLLGQASGAGAAVPRLLKGEAL
jgi:2-octaprenyl-6-methoxyphenol hydroxylase